MAGFAKQITRVHPLILTGILFASLLAPWLAAGLSAAPPNRPLLMTAPIGVMCIWYWAVYDIARTRKINARPYWGLLFAAPPLLTLIAGLAAWSMKDGPAAVAFFIVLFAVLWLSAKALEDADAATAKASFARVLITVLLMYLAPIGMWVLRRKIKRVGDGTLAL